MSSCGLVEGAVWCCQLNNIARDSEVMYMLPQSANGQGCMGRFRKLQKRCLISHADSLLSSIRKKTGQQTGDGGKGSLEKLNFLLTLTRPCYCVIYKVLFGATSPTTIDSKAMYVAPKPFVFVYLLVGCHYLLHNATS